MNSDFLGNPISDPLLSPSGRPSDPSTSGAHRDGVVNSDIDSSRGNGLSMEQMDMDMNATTLDISRLPSEVNGVTESDNSMRGSSDSQENHPSFRDMLTKGTVTAQQDSIISALNVDMQAVDVLINRIGAFPEIHFSDRIRKEIDTKLAKSVIVRLIEYEGLPEICFGCGKYGHSKEVCGLNRAGLNMEKTACHPEPPVDDKFGPWMQVSSRKRRPTVMCRGLHAENSGVAQKSGSQFDVLAPVVEGSNDELLQTDRSDIRGNGVELGKEVGRGKETAASKLGKLPSGASAGAASREQGRVLKGFGQHSLVVVAESENVVEVLPQIVESPVTSGHHEIQWIVNSTYEGDLQPTLQ
ncbi:hypothetical protein V6N13_048451 [Hibiscus sabdariffa]